MRWWERDAGPLLVACILLWACAATSRDPQALAPSDSPLCKSLVGGLGGPGGGGGAARIASHQVLGGGLIALNFSKVDLEPGTALLVLRNRALAAYGFGSEEEVRIVRGVEEGEWRKDAIVEVVLGVARDTGEHTLKEHRDICQLDALTLSVPAGEEGGGVGVQGAEGAVILFPNDGSRLLAGQSYVMHFTLERETLLSITVDGREVRQREEYEAGEHQTSIDFLPPPGGEGGYANVSLVAWGGETGETGRTVASVGLLTVGEPPSTLFQFPPLDFVYTDRSSVHLAVLVSYHAFLRHPRLEGGACRVLIDWHLGAELPVRRDAEGVFEADIAVDGSFAEDGGHLVVVELFDSAGAKLPGTAETLYHVRHAAVEAAGGGGGGGASGFRVEQWVPKEEAREVCRGDRDCGGHGRCHPEGTACICEGDWVGERCDVDLLTATEWLPDVPPHLDPARGARAAEFLRGARELSEVLEARRINATEACRGGTAMVFGYNDQGLAAQVSDASVQLSWAMKHGRLAAFEGEWTYGEHGGCTGPRRGVACHFRPHPTCGGAGFRGGGGEGFEAHPIDAIPDEFRGRGAFWWYARVTDHLLRPNDDFALKLRAAMAAVGFERPIVGVHVRNGDYCTHESGEGGHCLMYRHCICQGFEVYAERIRRMRDLYGVRTVFLATQDERIVRAARREGGVRVLSLAFDREQLTGASARKALHWRQRLGYVDAAMVSESALLDLLILAECDYFVGSFHSQYSRLAFQLMAARKGGHPPFASVHTSWGGGLTYPL